MFISAPKGGGVLVLNNLQIGNLDLICLIKRIYPQTKIVQSQPIPTCYPSDKD